MHIPPAEERSFTAMQTSEQRPRVFISSTTRELAVERSAARLAVRQLGLTPVLFESSTRPHPALALSRAYLEQSQIFIGIYWQSYGWVAPGEERSGIEDEYRYGQGLPKLIYVRTPAPERAPELKALLARIKAEECISYKYFNTAEQLGELIKNDLGGFLAGNPELSQSLPGQHPLIEAGPPNNLPGEPDRFIGRELQIEALRRLLKQQEDPAEPQDENEEDWQEDRPDIRLVTLTGPGGVGKTRLALEAAHELLDTFSEGVFFVDLAGSVDPALVLNAIARALGEREAAGQQLRGRLKAFLKNRRLLLVLDQIEPSAAPLVEELLSAAPGLKVLATSGEALGASGEYEFPLTSLSLPNPASQVPDAILYSEAVQLFVERTGGRGQTAWALTPENAPLAAEICRRLDGLPLAIELAAARARQIPLADLLEQLNPQPELEPGGARDRSARDQTLRSAIDWTYQLLEPAEQTTLARLAVFRGGGSTEAVELVCSPDGQIDVLDACCALDNLNLLQRELDAEGRLRFKMLETIREYALERLQESGDLAQIRERHARYTLAFVEKVGKNLSQDADREALDRIEAEIENVRAALDWSLEPHGTVELGARLAGSLFWFWYLRGYLSEGRARYQQILQSSLDRNTAAYAEALGGAGLMAGWLSDSPEAAAEACRLLNESIPRLRMANNPPLLAMALMNRGEIALKGGRLENAQPDLEESLAIFRELGQRFFTALCLMHLAMMALAQNQPETARIDTARSRLAEAGAIARGIRDPWLLPAAINDQGEAARFQGDYSRAGGYYDESGALFHEINARADLARIYHNQAYVALRRGDIRLANSLFRQGLEIYQQLGIQRGITECLGGLAEVLFEQGRAMPAARLLGFAQAQMEALGICWGPADQREIDRARAALQKQLGSELFTVEENAGRSQKLEAVLAEL